MNNDIETNETSSKTNRTIEANEPNEAKEIIGGYIDTIETDPIIRAEIMPPGEIIPRPINSIDIWREVNAKKKLRDDEKKANKHKNKGADKGHKTKKEIELDIYGDFSENFSNFDLNVFNPFLLEQSHYRKGNAIPEVLKMDLHTDSGFL